MTSPAIKICCVTDEFELAMAIDYRIDSVGFVSWMPSGPGIITYDKIRYLSRLCPNWLNSFLLTCRRTSEEIAAQWDYVQTKTIQLCYPLPPYEIVKLKSLLPHVNLVPVIHVNGNGSITKAQLNGKYADSFLLDTGCLRSRLIELGGTGRIHDWNISKIIRNKVGKFVWLAGGLKAANVLRAIELVRPDGVDVCSGIRTNGRLDHNKLRDFVEAVRRSATLNIPPRYWNPERNTPGD